MAIRIFICLLLCCCRMHSFAQTPESRPNIRVLPVATPPVIDGNLLEATWQEDPGATDFWQWFPVDTNRAESDTRIHLRYDDKNIYVAIYCHAAGPDFVVPNLRRDYRAGGNDNITLIFDTFGDETNAFFFGINPYGVRREGLIANGGNDVRDFSESWDNKWSGEAVRGPDFWSAEMVIPLRTLRFNEGSQQWKFNAYRFDTQSGERTSWIRVPRNQWVFSLGYLGDMLWETPVERTGTNIAVIPYVAASYGQDFESNGQPQSDFSAGGDAKIAVTSGLNLDLTINPDFSQVEVDRQVTDLSRFEIRFPERRQFFLENADLFSTFGSRNTNPFFSRRIGIVRDTFNDLNVANPIRYGARLSGKLNDRLRLGLLNMQTAPDEDIRVDGQNYTVAVVQQQVFERSNIGVIFVNKDATNRSDTLAKDFSRIIGVDYNIATADNRLTGKVFYHHAFNPSTNQDFAHGVRLSYLRRNYSLTWRHRYITEEYEAPVGFVPRTDYVRIAPEFRLFFYGSGNVPEHGPGVEMNLFLQPGFGMTDRSLTAFYNLSFLNTSRIRVELSNTFTYLFDPFDPTKTDAEPLPGEQGYSYWSLSGSFNSDRRKAFNVQLRPYLGEYFNGIRLGSSAELNVRLQPYAQLGLRLDYNYIDLPDPYATTTLFLVGPRFDLTFTKQLFLTTFVQYNSQSENLNVNARFQWRFAPVSDFFVVYTDNYLTAPFGTRNRALVGKLTYWLNL